MKFFNEEMIYRLYMMRHVIIIGVYELATSPHNIEKLAKLNKNDLGIIETEDALLKMTRDYLDLLFKEQNH